MGSSSSQRTTASKSAAGHASDRVAATRERLSTRARGVGSGRMPKGQLELPLTRGWGGARKGAGRKPAGRPKTAHVTRPKHVERHPVHVTLRSEVRQLRHPFIFPTVRIALDRAAKNAPERFRIIQWSVQYDHIHLLVEAADTRELSRGVQGLAVRVARYVNDFLGRRGRFWADRWHGRELTSPRAVRNALLYVLANFRKHARATVAPGVDAFSSGMHFDGWHPRERLRLVTVQGAERPPPSDPRSPCVTPARSWLAKVGWRRHGELRIAEEPQRPE